MADSIQEKVNRLISAGVRAKLVHVSPNRSRATIESSGGAELELIFDAGDLIYVENLKRHYTRRSTTGVGSLIHTPIDVIVGNINHEIDFYEKNPNAT